jgi:hypothetical protein
MVRTRVTLARGAVTPGFQGVELVARREKRTSCVKTHLGRSLACPRRCRSFSRNVVRHHMGRSACES